ncbi:hypothetical protein N7504_007222 [Penicillium tannophilum]|nr:hypothetical protein N7504_007222 [Penicillium tannophilum]
MSEYRQAESYSEFNNPKQSLDVGVVDFVKEVAPQIGESSPSTGGEPVNRPRSTELSPRGSDSKKEIGAVDSVKEVVPRPGSPPRLPVGNPSIGLAGASAVHAAVNRRRKFPIWRYLYSR